MPGYLTRRLIVRIGERDYLIRALSDLQQFHDPDGDAEQAGISSALWSLFGQVWPAGRVLAEVMSQFDIRGKRILEIGCGLGLSSLVLQGRDADVVASDHHPLAESFLARNADLNGMPVIAYCDLPWADSNTMLGRFDVLIGSDILYERHQVAPLVALMLRHARDKAEILITDPGRGNSNAFVTALAREGFVAIEERGLFPIHDAPDFKGRLIRLRRGG